MTDPQLRSDGFAASFNADSDAILGQRKLAFAGLDAFAGSEEAHEAFSEKRAPDFSKFR
jgi:1,4-dihydroxy-2-naphthoyl-CoA synthase